MPVFWISVVASLAFQFALSFPPCRCSEHQEDDHLVSGFSDIFFTGFQVSGNLETGNLVTDLVILKMYCHVHKSPFQEVSRKADISYESYLWDSF